jgi:hypothetical protein
VNAFAALDTVCDRGRAALRFGGASDAGFWSAEQGDCKQPSTVPSPNFRERLDWVMPFGCNRLLTSLLTLRLGFGLGAFSGCQPRMRGVKHHSLGPFMLRMDPDVDALTQRRPGRRRIGDIARKPPACGKKRGEKEASHPPEIP